MVGGVSGDARQGVSRGLLKCQSAAKSSHFSRKVGIGVVRIGSRFRPFSIRRLAQFAAVSPQPRRRNRQAAHGSRFNVKFVRPLKGK